MALIEGVGMLLMAMTGEYGMLVMRQTEGESL